MRLCVPSKVNRLAAIEREWGKTAGRQANKRAEDWRNWAASKQTLVNWLVSEVRLLCLCAAASASAASALLHLCFSASLSLCVSASALASVYAPLRRLPSSICCRPSPRLVPMSSLRASRTPRDEAASHCLVDFCHCARTSSSWTSNDWEERERRKGLDHPPKQLTKSLVCGVQSRTVGSLHREERASRHEKWSP